MSDQIDTRTLQTKTIVGSEANEINNGKNEENDDEDGASTDTTASWLWLLSGWCI